MKTWKKLYYFLGHLCSKLPLKLFSQVDNVSMLFPINLGTFLIRFISWPPLKVEAVCNFFGQIWLLFFAIYNVFCGEDFDDEASKICSRVRKYCGGAMRSFFKEVTSIFNRFISSSKFTCVVFRFSSSVFGVENVYVVLLIIFSQLILKIILQCYGIFLTSCNLNVLK